MSLCDTALSHAHKNGNKDFADANLLRMSQAPPRLLKRKVGYNTEKEEAEADITTTEQRFTRMRVD